MVHGLEVRANSVFDLSEAHKLDMQAALRRPLEAGGMTLAGKPLASEPRSKATLPAQRFSAHFSWLPMPLHVVEYILNMSGHVSTIQMVAWRNKCRKHMVRGSIPKLGGRGAECQHQ